MALVYCPGCSKQVDDQQDYCKFCGSSLEGAASIYDEKDDFEFQSKGETDEAFCTQCGHSVEHDAMFCAHCGAPQNNARHHAKKDAFGEVVHRNTVKEPNQLGVWAFVLALVSLFLPILYVDIAVGAVALVMAIIAMKPDKKRGLAIAALVLALISIVGAVTLIVEGDLDVYLSLFLRSAA